MKPGSNQPPSRGTSAVSPGTPAPSSAALSPDVAPHGRLLTTALETVANAVMITDRSGKILWTNPAFTQLTGYSPAEAIGRNPRLLKSGRHDAQFYKGLWGALLQGQAWHGEFTNRRKDGTLYYDEHTITPVRDAAGNVTHFVAIMQDVTARKQAEEEVRRLNAELEQRVRERTAQLQAANTELEAFSYSVSHDLRAPLRHIEGFVGLLSTDPSTALSEKERHFLHAIAGSSKQMRQLIDDLLAFSRLGQASLHLAPVAPNTLVEEARRQLEPDIQGRNITWKIAALPGVQADPPLLRQVLVNLLSNALKYTRPRNPAIIELGSLEAGPAETVLFVRDNGVGFDMKYAGNLFGVFQRFHLSDDFEGTGIGLANVRRIINRHGGRTWAEAEPDRGATFYFSLPKLVEPPPP